ncbi:MAG: hypothetical protein NTY19_30585 [Planctomycetota bacterium]|nr:hypothetical protein [Planctomycetota bacterium]
MLVAVTQPGTITVSASFDIPGCKGSVALYELLVIWEAEQFAKLREAGALRRIRRFANALIEGVRDNDCPGSDVNLLDWLRQCRRAGLYEQGKAIYEKGGLNSANLSDKQQIEAEDDYRICVRRGSDEVAKPKKRQRKIKLDDDE